MCSSLWQPDYAGLENISTNMAEADGKWTVDDDTDGQTQRFYRSVLP